MNVASNSSHVLINQVITALLTVSKPLFRTSRTSDLTLTLRILQ